MSATQHALAVQCQGPDEPVFIIDNTEESDTRFVCRMKGLGEEVINLARLFAASPGLFAALERLERCDRLGCNCESVKAVCGPDSVCDSCFALAAIAKAKPKDPCSVCGGSHGLCATLDCDNPVDCDPEERGESWVYCDSCDAEMKGGA